MVPSGSADPVNVADGISFHILAREDIKDCFDLVLQFDHDTPLPDNLEPRAVASLLSMHVAVGGLILLSIVL
jgi:hypothetical protein